MQDVQTGSFTLWQISISWNFPLKYTCWIILTNAFHLFILFVLSLCDDIPAWTFSFFNCVEFILYASNGQCKIQCNRQCWMSNRQTEAEPEHLYSEDIAFFVSSCYIGSYSGTCLYNSGKLWCFWFSPKINLSSLCWTCLGMMSCCLSEAADPQGWKCQVQNYSCLWWTSRKNNTTKQIQSKAKLTMEVLKALLKINKQANKNKTHQFVAIFICYLSAHLCVWAHAFERMSNGESRRQQAGMS